MSTKNERTTSEFEREVFNFLNILRESGITNMFGATPYVEKEFGIGKNEARKLLTMWMANFSPEGDYRIIVIK